MMWQSVIIVPKLILYFIYFTCLHLINTALLYCVQIFLIELLHTLSIELLQREFKSQEFKNSSGHGVFKTMLPFILLHVQLFLAISNNISGFPHPPRLVNKTGCS